jgi:hypothetical protein
LIIKCKLYNRLFKLYNTNILNSYKKDYIATLPFIKEIKDSTIINNIDNNLDIYLDNNNKKQKNELITYLEEKRATKNVSFIIFLISILIII